MLIDGICALDRMAVWHDLRNQAIKTKKLAGLPGHRRITMSKTLRKYRKKSTGPTLSLCMIVKNEAEGLEKCLSLARPHVDEIVVVDTGSTDGTQEIARRYADVFDEIEWPNSFSIARNYSFDLATGDFILILDGDEYIPELDHWQLIRRTIQEPDIAAVQLIVRNVMRGNQILAADRIYQERIIPNHPDVRYWGRIHNQIQDIIVEYARKTGKVILQADAEIIHTGYAYGAEKMKEKYGPRLQLLEVEYESAPSEHLRAYYAFQLGVSYFVMEQYDVVLQIYGFIQYDVLSDQNAFYAHLLAAQAALKLKDSSAALLHSNEMLAIDRSEPVGYYTTALALMNGQQVLNGILFFLEAFKINQQAGVSVRFMLDPKFLVKSLGNICISAGLDSFGVAFMSLIERSDLNFKMIEELVDRLRVGLVLQERNQQAA